MIGDACFSYRKIFLCYCSTEIWLLTEPNLIKISWKRGKEEKSMSHPSGGMGNTFRTEHSFSEAYIHVGTGITFRSTTGEKITATQGLAGDGMTKTIVFVGERSEHGHVCKACWGYRCNCNGTRIGHCVEGLDANIKDL